MPDRPNPRAAELHGPDASGLPDALAERLRALPAPDPGTAYFGALPGRVAARLADASSAAPHARFAPARFAPARFTPSQRVSAQAAPDRSHQRSGRLRTGRAWQRLVAAACMVAALVWWTGRPAALPQVAQQRPSVPSDVPAPILPDAAPRLDPPPATPKAPIRARPLPPVGPRTHTAPLTPPRRTQRLAFGAPARPDGPATPGVVSAALVSTGLVSSGRATRDSLDAEGIRLLRRAHLVVTALQNADRPEDVALLAPLAEGLAADLARWRSTAADPLLRASAERLEPVVLGLAALAPADTAAARTLRTVARQADLTLHLDRALLATDGTVHVAF